MSIKTVATFGDLVRAVQDSARSDAEVVAVIGHLLTTRSVAFCRALKRTASSTPAQSVPARSYNRAAPPNSRRNYL